MQLHEIASKLNCQYEGDPALEITAVAPLTTAQPGDLTFVGDAKYLPLLEQTAASAVILDRQSRAPAHVASLRTDQPRLLFAKAIELFYQPYSPPIGIHPTAVIAADVQLGNQVSIGPHVVLMEGVQVGDHTHIHANVTIYPQVKIGQDCTLYANCVIHERSVIGNHCLIHSGAVIGDDGFGHVPQPDGRWYRMQQSGCVVLEDDVDIGSNTTLDRPAVGETRIGQGTKIDNLVQIGHGVLTGRHCVIVSQVGLAGGTELGNHVVLGGQVGVAGHLKIGDGAMVAAGTGVTGDIPAGETIAGFPHQPSAEWRRTVAVQRNLPELAKTVRRLEKRMAELENNL
jgi:UDP-3-O-[3-hydroxymyristoyl] glucosamine N-acyltransferase